MSWPPWGQRTGHTRDKKLHAAPCLRCRIAPLRPSSASLSNLEEAMNLIQLAALRRRRGQPLSRRHFVKSATSALAAGAALTSGVWTPLALAREREHEHDPANPIPIPIGSFGFHVNAPGFPGLDSVDA